MIRTIGALALSLAIGSAYAFADMGLDDKMAGPSAEGAGSSAEFEKANQKMHAGMTMTFTGDADVDFVTGMIPHHQGAIDMAKVEIKYGKDPEIKKLAEDIIAAQEGEIALMNAWLAKHKNEAGAGKTPPAGGLAPPN